MTLLFADGFEDGSAAWTLGTAMTIGAGGRFGNGLVGTATTLNASAYMSFPATVGPMIVGCAFKPAGVGSIYGVTFMPNSNYHTILSRGSSGEIICYRTNTAGILGTSAIGVLPIGAWSYVEMKTIINDTTGYVIVRVNGIQVLNLTNVDTRDSTGTMSNFNIGSVSVFSAFTGNAWDDVYVCDSLGTVNNDFLGEIAVEHLRPASDDTAQWLGSDGNSVNNWDLVDEAGTYSGADYVASSTVGQRDLYVPTPSTRPITSPVAAVMVSTVAQKTDAGVRTVKMNVKEGSGGTVRQSAELGLPTSFGEVNAIFERKGDGSQFTVADVNALRFGVEVAS